MSLIFFKSRVSESVAHLKTTLSHLLLRIGMGLILVSIVTIALVHLSIDLSAYLDQLEYGQTLKTVFFILLAIGGSVGLAILARPTHPKGAALQTPPQKPPSPSMQDPDALTHLATTLAVRFAEGFVTTVIAQAKRSPPESDPAGASRSDTPAPASSSHASPNP